MKDRLAAFAVYLIFMSPFVWAWVRHEPEPIPAPQEVKEIDILGHYALSGEIDSGKGYSGTVLIAKAGKSYAVTWVLERGGVCKGIGMREGNVLMVGAVQEDVLTVFRFTISEQDGKPKLTGRWAQGSGNGMETLTLLRRPSL